MSADKKLTIGDPESIKARDKGRLEAWKSEIEKELRARLQAIQCPIDCTGGGCSCAGPTVQEIFHCGVVWICSRANLTCSCCGQDIEHEFSPTDFKGVVLEPYIGMGERKPFDPAEYEKQRNAEANNG